MVIQFTLFNNVKPTRPQPSPDEYADINRIIKEYGDRSREDRSGRTQTELDGEVITEE